MNTKNIIKFIVAIVICQLAGIIGAVFTTPAISTWYVTLKKPVFNPPNWIFGPVWTILFLLMGISLYLVWNEWAKRNDLKNAKTAFILFGVQLFLNIIWSIIFFGLHSPMFAFIEIIILWAAILLTIMHFNKISKTATYLLIPYILWVSFAAVLNLFVWLLK